MMRQPRDVEFATGQRLAQFVMDFARNARPLLLAHVLKINGQRTQLFVRFAQLDLGHHAILPFLRFAHGAIDPCGTRRARRVFKT